jgi:hypothetical protein
LSKGILSCTSSFIIRFLACFVTRHEAQETLQREPVGSFIIRLSERLDGEFVVSYHHHSGVRHYLIQPEDIADKKKTLVDFLGQNKMFVYILQVRCSSAHSNFTDAYLAKCGGLAKTRKG